ncbi:MAG: MauE/DoxX family redox-associated membrane protein [Verrucomicrobiota bacterium]
MNRSDSVAPDTGVDPVCGMVVSADAPHRAKYAGHEFRFCGEGCRKKFEAAPERYANRDVMASGATDGMAPLARRSPPKGKGSGDDSAGMADSKQRGGWSAYLPLLILISLAALAAAAIEVGKLEGSMRGWMHGFMGLFFVLFAMFKLFDLSGFADGFQMYDLLAKRFRPYAYVYPFIELALGLGYLAAWSLPVVYGATVGVMLFGAIGVIRALRRGLDINCACMGTVLKVPLSTVALTEDLGMAAMAAAMWVASN